MTVDHPPLGPAGEQTKWVAVVLADGYYAPSGTALHFPDWYAMECTTTQDSRRHSRRQCWCPEPENRQVLRVTATSWLRWTRLELTDSAVFRDHETGIDWTITRVFPSRPADHADDTIRYAGAPAGHRHADEFTRLLLSGKVSHV